MGAFTIFVTVKLKPGQRDAFLPIIRENAEITLREEPQCLQFDIMVPEDMPDTVCLYEIYDEPASLAAHTKLPHYKSFHDAADPLIEEIIRVKSFREE